MIRSFVGLVVLLSSMASTAALPAYDANGQVLPTLAPMLKEVNPAVVNIATFSQQEAYNPLLNDPYFRNFFGAKPRHQLKGKPQRKQQSAGSGVIVDAKAGIVMTNYHVIKDADEVQVSLIDGRNYRAVVKGSDPDLDIAILKIDAEDLTDLKIANSDLMEVGDFVVAIGNPFGLGQTVTTGIVSALGRSGLGIEGYENFIQTDASINPGNSGGALVNLRGELIGINTAIISPAGGNVGIGFAIPVNMAKSSMDQILVTGEVKRGQIGVSIQDITPDLQKAFELDNGQRGVLINDVLEGTPADKAGLESGDIIVAIDGSETLTSSNLRSQIGVKSIGDSLRVTVIRDGKKRKFTVKVGEPNSDASSGEIHPLLEGAVFEKDPDSGSVIVLSVAPNSRAAYAGLRPSDAILGVNRKKVIDVASLRKLISRDQTQILLHIGRNGRSFYVVLR
ncbi:MAG: Do/DeqQ family serine protease [Flavobacteriales bacterium]|jgi:Do/DeqQ family serine protease